MKSQHKNSYSLPEILWNGWCVVSVVGIWPRFIEPNLLRTTQIPLPIQHLPPDLEGVKILQFSDLHLHPRTPETFLKKLISRIHVLSPDLIVFTGDCLCNSILHDEEQLKRFFSSLKAPHGCFAILGNHDYEQCITINDSGEYDTYESGTSTLVRGFKRLLTPTTIQKTVTDRAREVGLNTQLIHLFQQTPFTLLENASECISIHNSHLNICGLGEYMLGRCRPVQAFQNYDSRYPGIILAHNPDSVPLLKEYPGEVILCGHTHGGQVNLPWIWKRLTALENMQYKQGLKSVFGKWIYINRGVGGVFPFRWFCSPEITLFTLRSCDG